MMRSTDCFARALGGGRGPIGTEREALRLIARDPGLLARPCLRHHRFAGHDDYTLERFPWAAPDRRVSSRPDIVAWLLRHPGEVYELDRYVRYETCATFEVIDLDALKVQQHHRQQRPVAPAPGPTV